MHSAGHSRHGRDLSGQVRYGQDGSVCVGHSAAARAHRQPGVGDRYVPYTRARLSDMQGVRALLQVHAHGQGECVLRRHWHQEGRGDAQEELSAHCGWHARSYSGPGTSEYAQSQVDKALCAGRV